MRGDRAVKRTSSYPTAMVGRTGPEPCIGPLVLSGSRPLTLPAPFIKPIIITELCQAQRDFVTLPRRRRQLESPTNGSDLRRVRRKSRWIGGRPGGRMIGD
jgi:hypothetical protein